MGCVVAVTLLAIVPPDTTFVAFVALVALVAVVADVADVADVAVAAFPLILIPQVPEAPVPVSDGISVPMSKPKLVRAVEAVVAPVPPLATASVPANVTAPVVGLEGVSPVVPPLKLDTIEPIVPQLVLVPSVVKYLPELLVCDGKKAFNAAFAVVCPVPPLAIGSVPVTPVVSGSPVALVNVPDEGVPSAPPLVTKAPEDPTFTARAVATLVPRPDTPVAIGRFVQLVSTPEVGVPSTAEVSVGLLNVGEVMWLTACTTSVPSDASTILAPLGTETPVCPLTFTVTARPPVVLL